jgi:hypothetical protein
VPGHVFISYSRQDRAYVQQLAEDLRRQAIDVWLDDVIVTGERWASVIQRAIDSAAGVLVVMSSDSANSEWVQYEIDYARHHAKPILPLLLNGRPFVSLATLQFEDVSGGRAPSEPFVAGLRALANRPVVTSPDVGPTVSLEDRSGTKIFVNYRRSDSAFAAHWMHQSLVDWFGHNTQHGPDSFFIDVNIEPGRKFKDVVRESIRQCQVLLAVVGDRWLDAELNGMRRLDLEGDLVRQEIELALEYRVTIVPLILEPAVMPVAEQLPSSIREMTDFQAVHIQAANFRSSVDYLAPKLAQILRA